jgi:monofunctional biosynthetic peptidoglycan transglycosylase
VNEQARTREPAAGDQIPNSLMEDGESVGTSQQPLGSAAHASLAALKQRYRHLAERATRYAAAVRAAAPSLRNNLATRAGRGLRVLLRVLAALALAYLAIVLTLIVVYRWVDPPASMLMLTQRIAGEDVIQHWVPLHRISPYLPLAVINSEDGQFCHHHGVDWEEIGAALDTDGEPRGGSTISMQVVKNLFLWPSRSYIRKAIEIPLAYVIELAWSKPRILEIYLNIAEWGPGIFGAEAAARYHFHKPASVLTPRESALMAVSLPNPYVRRAGHPGPKVVRLSQRLMLRMGTARGRMSCITPALAGANSVWSVLRNVAISPANGGRRKALPRQRTE